MKNRTRVVKGLIFTPSQSDVQDLLAAIAEIERKEQTQVASERLTLKDEGHQPRSSPTQQNRRLSKALNSLANLCVSEVKHEVIATALRVDYKAGSIELIMASNTDVQDSTVAHLQEIWKTLQQLSPLCHKHHQLSPPPQVLNLFTKLIQLCLEFSFSRLQKRINKNFHRFFAIDVNNSDPEHPLHFVRTCVNVLAKIFTCDKGAAIGKPRHDDTETWVQLWECLKSTKRAIDSILDDEGFCAGAEAFLGYESYLRKVESLANDIGVLAKLAYSPYCKHLFTFKFKVIPIRGQVSKAISGPQTPKDWETVFEKALLYRNRYKGPTEEEYVIDEEKIEKDTADIAKKAIKLDLVIHCEVKILLHIFKTENEIPSTSKTKNKIPSTFKTKNEIPGIPKAYTYIGVSKLSCRGCCAFFDAFNIANQTHFVTKGSHSKSYWPWQFPHGVPNGDAVLSDTYRFIAHHWVGSYDGYKVKQVPLTPDSDGSHLPNLTEETGISGSPHSTNQDEYAVINLLAQRLAKV